MTSVMEHMTLSLTSDNTPTAQSAVVNESGTVPTTADYDLIDGIRFYSLGVVIFVGLVCNTTSLGVLAASKILRRTTTGHYLLALSVADILFVIGEILRWLNTEHYVVGIKFMHSSDFVCKFVFYLRYASKLTSAWITVVITVERFVTVAFPLKVSRVSTPLTAKVTIAVTYTVWFALSAYPFWTVGLKEWDGGLYCAVVHKELYDDWSLVILRVMSLMIPAVIICILTGMIICVLGRSASRRCHQLEGQSRNSARKSSSVERQLTAMLLAVAVAFVLLRLPYTICYYVYAKRLQWFGEPIDEWLDYRIYVAVRITDIFATANYAINFFLYCLCGSAFRQQLRQLGKQRRIRMRVSFSTRIFKMVAVENATCTGGVQL